MNNRRILLIAFASHAVAAPFASLAQQKKVWRVGFLSQGTLESFNYDAFRQGMREIGYVGLTIPPTIMAQATRVIE